MVSEFYALQRSPGTGAECCQKRSAPGGSLYPWIERTKEWGIAISGCATDFDLTPPGWDWGRRPSAETSSTWLRVTRRASRTHRRFTQRA